MMGMTMELDPSASFSRAYDHLPDAWRDLISINRLVSPRDIVAMYVEGDRRSVDGLLDHQRDLMGEIMRDCPVRDRRAARWLGDPFYDRTIQVSA